MMTREELIRSLEEGGINRRQFIRKMLTTGVSLSSALVYANALSPVFAKKCLSTNDLYYGQDCNDKDSKIVVLVPVRNSQLDLYPGRPPHSDNSLGEPTSGSLPRSDPPGSGTGIFKK